MYDIDKACREAMERISADIEDNIDDAKSVIQIQFADLKHRVDLLHKKQELIINDGEWLFDGLYNMHYYNPNCGDEDFSHYFDI